MYEAVTKTDHLRFYEVQYFKYTSISLYTVCLGKSTKTNNMTNAQFLFVVLFDGWHVSQHALKCWLHHVPYLCLSLLLAVVGTLAP